MIKQQIKDKIVVTGGGSGGHISACSAIITALQERYDLNDTNFMYIGGDLGMEGEQNGKSLEQQFFQKDTFQKKYIRAGKLQRKISLRTIKLLFRTLLGIKDTKEIFTDFTPDIVISTGGFVTVPVCLVAKRKGAKIYLHEQTSTVGLANKIVGKFAEKIFITFDTSKQYFPKEKTIHTGNLVRKEIFNKSGKGPIIEPLKKMLIKQEELPIVYISGGGQGSHIINITTKDILEALLQDFQIVLQVGDNKVNNDYDTLLQQKNALPYNLKDRLILTKYINKEEIGMLLNNTDIFIGRAGANTVYELGTLQIPSILIPIPWVTHNEQEKNAEILVSTGLGKIINEAELTPEKLLLELKNFSKEKKHTNKEKLEKIFTTNAANKILENIEIN